MTAAAWLQAHAAGARQALDLSIAGLIGLHTRTPWGLYRRAAVALSVRLLKGNAMTPLQTQTLIQDLKAAAAFVVQIVEAMLEGSDGPTKRAKAIELITQGLAAGELALHAPPLVIAITTNATLIGFLVDQAVKEANQLGLFASVPVVPQLEAPPTMLAPEDLVPAEHVEGSNDGLGSSGG